MPAQQPAQSHARSKIPYSAAELEKRIQTLPTPPHARIWTVSAVEVDNWSQVLRRLRETMEVDAYKKYAIDKQ